jgi:hypothetical protein
MNTVIVRNTARKTPRGPSYTILVVGDSPVKASLMESIRALENHPAPTPQRSLIDMLGLIEKHNLQIRYTEHQETEDGLEHWSFVLQG